MSQSFKIIKPLSIVLALVVLYFLVQWLVHLVQKPGHMGVIESQSMDMSVRPPAGAMPVQTELVRVQPFAASVRYSANAVAFNEITIYPRVEGRLTKLSVYPGQQVHVGQVIAELDAQELNARSQEAQASEAASVAQREKARLAIQNAKAALTYKEAQIQRSRALVADDVITKEEAQKDESEYAAAKAEYQQSLAELNASQKMAEAASSQVQTQQIIQGYTRITAPQSGIVSQRMLSVGTLVNPGTPILQIIQRNPIRVQASVAEQDMPRIHVGSPVKIWRQHDMVMTGQVSSVFPKTDLQTRTTLVEAQLDNLKQQLLPGDFVTMSIETGIQLNTLTVANSALVTVNGQQAVWIMNDGKAHLQFVTTAETDGSRTAITNGLKAGDAVIMQGNQNLTEGMPVTQADYGKQGLKALPKLDNTKRLSQANHYQIQHLFDMYVTRVTAENKPPHSGKNTFTVDVISGPAMPMSTAGIAVESSLKMVSMPGMTVSKPTIEKTGNGRFKVTTQLDMPGLWALTVAVKDDGESIGSFPVEIEIPE